MDCYLIIYHHYIALKSMLDINFQIIPLDSGTFTDYELSAPKNVLLISITIDGSCSTDECFRIRNIYGVFDACGKLILKILKQNLQCFSLNIIILFIHISHEYDISRIVKMKETSLKCIFIKIPEEGTTPIPGTSAATTPGATTPGATTPGATTPGVTTPGEEITLNLDGNF